MTDASRDEGVIWSADFTSYRESLPLVLESTHLVDELASYQTVLIKPNLVEDLDPPITTHVDLVKALVDYILQHHPEIRIIVGEGTGALEYDTFHCFEQQGYAKLSDRVQLLDLNIEPCRRLTNDRCKRWPEMYLPELLFDCFLISVPVLKAHSLCRVTLTMKNMMGCAPPAHYQQGGAWGKSSFHMKLDEAVFDLNRYRTPDFTVIDAAVGMAKAHLWGPTCSPPVGKIVASYDPVAVDAYGTGLLKKSWRDIGHIKMANGILGRAEPLDVREPTHA
ncbi:MAG: DUF362 domain-containing protein [Desulfofustis sp.]|nr:DUF362 domain-containing protein [Desulfofustis sp.]MBT8355877.1 DUF362 domain-containing protein [Desulfofustis sp.]NNK57585.1 DUF362 domain-containing protein [Desulfofustis sp.]